MKLKLAAVLALAAMTAVNEAQAAFTYTVSPVTQSTNFGSGSNLTVAAFNGGAPSGTLSGTQIINVAQITQSSTTAPPATDTANIPVSLTVTVTNAGGSSNFVITGNINITRSDTQGSASTFSLTNILPPSFTLGGLLYTLGSPQYAAPTIQAGAAGNGSLSLTITETPEPASLALMGIGTAALGGLAMRRRLQKA